MYSPLALNWLLRFDRVSGSDLVFGAWEMLGAHQMAGVERTLGSLRKYDSGWECAVVESC